MRKLFIPTVISVILVVVFIVVNIFVFLAIEVASGNAIADAIKFAVALISSLSCCASIVVVWLAWFFGGFVTKHIENDSKT